LANGHRSPKSPGGTPKPISAPQGRDSVAGSLLPRGACHGTVRSLTFGQGQSGGPWRTTSLGNSVGAIGSSCGPCHRGPSSCASHGTVRSLTSGQGQSGGPCLARGEGPCWGPQVGAAKLWLAVRPGNHLRPPFAGACLGTSPAPPWVTIVTWLILPVVICLSQRLSHACLSISNYTVKLRMAH
jgi:hypothetical protein